MPTWQDAAQGMAVRTIFGLPGPVMRLLAGPTVQRDGLELDLEPRLLTRLMRLQGSRGLSARSPERARANMRQAQQFGTRALPGVQVTERRIALDGRELGARLYRPVEAAETSPLLVFFHGGGWVIGDLDTHDALARFLAKYAGVRVFSVGYRLAPENPFPAAVQDALDAFRHAVEHAEELGTTPEAIAVGGDSAGGNLAAVVAHQTVRLGERAPFFQLLLYPATDGTRRRRSRDLFAENLLLTDADMTWFADQYVPDLAARADPRFSVLLADDHTNLPPAYVATAGFDPLRDEGEAYAEALENAGVTVVRRRFPGQIHGFASLVELGGSFREATFEIAATLRAAPELRSTP